MKFGGVFIGKFIVEYRLKCKKDYVGSSANSCVQFDIAYEMKSAMTQLDKCFFLIFPCNLLHSVCPHSINIPDIMSDSNLFFC